MQGYYEVAAVVSMFTLLSSLAGMFIGCGVFSRPLASYMLWVVAENLPLFPVSFGLSYLSFIVSLTLTALALVEAAKCKRVAHVISFINGLTILFAGVGYG